MSFADTFSFSRPSVAAYVDAAGVTRQAAVDQPRFDRGAGLLVDAGAALGQGDRVRLVPRDWSASPTWTVLHGWDGGGPRRFDAHYTTDPAAMIDGCLATIGRHARVAAVPGYLKNYGGGVWALGQRWNLAGVIGAGARAVGDSGRALLVR